MSCSLQALQTTMPINLFCQTKIMNQSGIEIDLIVAIYSLGEKAFAEAPFFPDQEKTFTITQAYCHLPEEAYISLFGYQQGTPPSLLGERHLLFTEFFSRDQHEFWG